MRADPKDVNRSIDILEVTYANFRECRRNFAGHLLVDGARQVNAAWLRQVFEPRRDIDAVAKDILITVDNDVSDIDTDTKINPSVTRNIDSDRPKCEVLPRPI